MDTDHRVEALVLLAAASQIKTLIVRARRDCANDTATEDYQWQLVASAERQAQVHAALALDDRLAALNTH